jgi:hypothetical protein
MTCAVDKSWHGGDHLLRGVCGQTNHFHDDDNIDKKKTKTFQNLEDFQVRRGSWQIAAEQISTLIRMPK